MASRRDVITFLTAPARSGKSFNEVRKICDEILPQENGMIYTNLPLKCEKIAEYCENKYGLDKEKTLARIHIIPRETELEWRRAGQPYYDETGRMAGKYDLTGPWDYFADKILPDSTIIIDEIHNFCGSIGTPKAISNQWQAWLGELGHSQAVFRCLSQAPEKVHNSIKQEAQASFTIMNTGLSKDPYFGIEIYDWLELYCGFLGGQYRVFVFEQETKKVEGRKVSGTRKMHLMGQPYFSFYDSFNAPIAHAQLTEAKPFENEYERQLKKGPIKGRIGLLGWFFRRHSYQLISRSFIGIGIATLIILMISGTLTTYMMNIFTSMTPKAKTVHTSKKTPTSSPPTTKKELSPEEQKLKLLNDEIKGKTEKISELEKEIEKASAITLMTENTITMRGGYTYNIGETIDTGTYKGRKIISLNWTRRSIKLDDENILNLGD